MNVHSAIFGNAQDEHGLGFNIEHILALTGWSYGQVAEQMYPKEPPDGMNRKNARKGIALVVGRKQKHWRRHLGALAWAWGLPESVLLYDDLRRCPTLEALEARYGFRRIDVMQRWEQHVPGLFRTETGKDDRH